MLKTRVSTITRKIGVRCFVLVFTLKLVCVNVGHVQEHDMLVYNLPSKVKLLLEDDGVFLLITLMSLQNWHESSQKINNITPNKKISNEPQWKVKER